MLFKIAEGFTYQFCHAQAVGFDSPQFLDGIQIRILIADAGTVEIHLHSSQLADELVQTVNRLSLGDIHHLVGHDALCFGNHLSQNLFPSSSHTHSPSSLCKESRHLITYA